DIPGLFGGRNDQRVSTIGRKTFGLRQTELLTHDVGAEHHRHDLVVGVPPAHAFAAHAAIGGQNQALDGDVLEGATNVFGNLLGPLDLQRVVIDHADADLLVGDDLAEGLEIHAACARRLESDHVVIDLVQHLERVLVALYVLEHALLRRITPAGVAPDFG